MILTNLGWSEQIDKLEKVFLLSWWKGQEEVLIFPFSLEDCIHSGSLAEVWREGLGTWVMGRGKRKLMPSVISVEYLYNESF